MTPLDRLRELAGTDDVEYVRAIPRAWFVGAAREELNPTVVIRIGSQYLVETAEEPGEWYMGQLDRGEIVCWGRYGPLEDAVRGL